MSLHALPGRAAMNRHLHDCNLVQAQGWNHIELRHGTEWTMKMALTGQERGRIFVFVFSSWSGTEYVVKEKGTLLLLRF